jgi:HlyD family secretion protein
VDIIREDISEKKRKKRIVMAAAAAGAILLITLGLSRLKPAAPTVEKSTVWMDTVKRGPMVRQVRGPGSLVVESSGIRVLSAATEGRVERLLLEPGALVQPDTVILEMSNPELQRDAADAEQALKAGQAEFVNTKVKIQREVLDQKAQAASVESDYHQAELQAETNEGLHKEGIVASLVLKLSEVRANELKTRNALEKERLAIAADAAKAQLDAAEAHLQQLKVQTELFRSQMEALKVRATIPGVLQEIPVQVGQLTQPGTMLAKVVQPNKLKAQLKIAETQAKDIAIGQPAKIDTRNGIVTGKVRRIDPAVQNGTVTVDVSLEGEMPRGARPDLSVDGTIEVERLPDVLHVGRPAYGQANSAVGLFKLTPDGSEATRATVRLGRTSVNTVEIVGGLSRGDKVIISDMSRWDGYDRVRVD